MPTSARRTRMALIAVAAAVAASVVVAAPAHAADITVTSSADAGAGSLRAALAGAASGDRIVFDPSVTSVVLESALAVTVGVHIDGPGAGLLTISRVAASNFNEIQLVGAVGEDYVLEGLTLDGTGSQAPAIYADLNTDDVTLRDVVVSNQTSIIGGAALYTFQTDGDFLFEDCVFEGNVNVGLLAGAEGGALKLDGVGGDVTIRNSAFVGNTSGASAGAAWIGGVAGDLVIEDSTFRGNVATEGPGGALRVESLDGAASITRSSFLDNEAGTDFTFGGAVFGQFPELTVQSSTFAGNSLPGGGIGISIGGGVPGPALIQNSTFDETGDDEFALYFSGVDSGQVPPTLDILNSTIVGPAGLYVETNEGDVTVENTIIQATNGRAVATDTGAAIHVSWSILSSPLDSDIADDGNNRFSTDALLGALADNGGPTLTRLPNATSPAINGGDPAVVGAPEFDQRGAGFARILQGRLDVGAVETAALASTGATLAWPLPVAGGLLLLAGIGAVVLARRTRRARAI